MSEEDKGFRVVDKRGTREEKKEETQGQGFTMSESGTKDPAPDQIDFSTLVFSLATGAFVHLGATPDPITKKTAKNLPLAKQNIDILDLLKDKTKGNLSKEEDALLDGLLSELRLGYVRAVS